ncbi:hypothetical protein [Roseateles sp. P5_E4]
MTRGRCRRGAPCGLRQDERIRVRRDRVLLSTAAPGAFAAAPGSPGFRFKTIARTAVYGALTWQPTSGWRTGLEARALSKAYVNDLNSDAAPGYAALAAYVGYQLSLGPWDFGALLRVDNLTGRRYAGSVIVNDGNGRFFEPAPGRTWLASANASYRF